MSANLFVACKFIVIFMWLNIVGNSTYVLPSTYVANFPFSIFDEADLSIGNLRLTTTSSVILKWLPLSNTHEGIRNNIKQNAQTNIVGFVFASVPIHNLIVLSHLTGEKS